MAEPLTDDDLQFYAKLAGTAGPAGPAMHTLINEIDQDRQRIAELERDWRTAVEANEANATGRAELRERLKSETGIARQRIAELERTRIEINADMALFAIRVEQLEQQLSEAQQRIREMELHQSSTDTLLQLSEEDLAEAKAAAGHMREVLREYADEDDCGYGEQPCPCERRVRADAALASDEGKSWLEQHQKMETALMGARSLIERWIEKMGMDPCERQYWPTLREIDEALAEPKEVSNG